jgi:hypothetical protein
MGVRTDGARSMSDIHGVLQTLILQKSPCALSAHCIIHRPVIASKHVSPELEEVLEIVINVVNYIKTKVLNARMFATLYEEMDAEHFFNIFALNQNTCLGEIFYDDCLV